MLNKKKRVAITIAMILIGFSIVLMIVAVILNTFDSSGGNDEPSNNTLENNTVTLRDRDTMEQVTLSLDEVIPYIEERIKF